MDYHVILSNGNNNEVEIYNLINTTILDAKVFIVENYEQIEEAIEKEQIDYLYIPTELIQIQKIKLINFTSLDIKIIYFGKIKDNLDIYQTSHMYYIDKPYSKEQIQKIYRKGIFEKNQRNKDVLTIKLKKDILTIPYKEIIYIYSTGRYVNICSKYYEHKVIAKLDQIENLLNNYFYRTHQSFIVNITKVRKLTSKYCYVGKTYLPIPVTKTKAMPLKKKILELYINE